MPERNTTPLGRALLERKKGIPWLAKKTNYAISYLEQIADGHLRPGFELCFVLARIFPQLSVADLRNFPYTSVINKSKTKAA